MRKHSRLLLGGVAAIATSSVFFYYTGTDHTELDFVHSPKDAVQNNDKGLSTAPNVEAAETVSHSTGAQVSEVLNEEKASQTHGQQYEFSTEKLAKLTPKNKALVDAVNEGRPIQLELAGVQRQLLLAPRQIFSEEAMIHWGNGDVLLDANESVHVSAGGVSVAAPASVPAQLVGVIESNTQTQIVPENGMGVDAFLAGFDAQSASMVVIGESMVVSMYNVNNDKVLLRHGANGMEMRYEPTAMHQKAFGECQAGACNHDHTKDLDPLAIFEEIDQQIEASGGDTEIDFNQWVTVKGGTIAPSTIDTGSDEYQAITDTVDRDPITGADGLAMAPLPLGEKYSDTLHRGTIIAQAEPVLYDYLANPTEHDISVMLCRLLISFERANTIYERNATMELVVGELTVRREDDPLWATDHKGDTIAYSWRGGAENMMARGRIKAWGGGGGALGRNFGISAWDVGIVHELAHILGLGHTTHGADLMGPTGGPPNFWGLDIGANRNSLAKLYSNMSQQDGEYANYSRGRLLEDLDEITGEGDGILNTYTQSGTRLRNPQETAWANDDSVVTAVNTAVEFDPLANDDHATPHSPHYNNDLVIEEIGRIVPAGSGTVEIIDDGKRLRFTPTANFQGNVRFNYTMRGDVGNNGRGWLSRAPIGIVVGTPVEDPNNLTFAPGEDRLVIYSDDVAIVTYPTMADLYLNENDIVYRVHPNATGSEQFNITVGGTQVTVTLTYNNPARVAVDDSYDIEDGKTLRFNPLINDEVTGSQWDEWNISLVAKEVVDAETERNYNFNRAYVLKSASLTNPAMGSLELEKNYKVFPDGSFGSGLTNYLLFTPADGASGYAEISYTAEDLDGTEFSGTAKILVGLAEIARPARQYTRVREDHGLALETTLIPASGGTFTGTSALQWSVVNKPTGSTVTFENDTSANAVAFFDTPGRYRLRLTADDNGNVKTLERWVFVEALADERQPGVEYAPWINSTAKALNGWSAGSWNTNELGVEVKDDSFANLIDLARLGTSTDHGDYWEHDLGADSAVNWVDLFFGTLQQTSNYDLEVRLLDASRTVVKTFIPEVFSWNQNQYRFNVSNTGDVPVRYVQIHKKGDTSSILIEKFQVMGRSGDLANITRNGTATQSTTWQNGDTDFAAYRAVDNLTGYNRGSRTDDTTTDNWWEYSLDSETELSALFLELETANNLGQVTVYNASDAQVWQTTLDGSLAFTFDSIPAGTMAKRIRVTVPSGATQGLRITELEAYGKKPNALTTAWSQTNSSVSANFADSTAVATAVTMGANGNYGFRLTADDGWNKTVRDFPVAYDSSVSGPVARGADDLTLSAAGGSNSVDLYALFDDAQTADASLTYAVVSVGNASLFATDPVGAIADPANFALDLASGAVGSSTVVISATDGDGNTTQTTINVATANQAPQVPNVVNLYVSETATNGTVIGDLKTFVTDAEGDNLTFSYPWLPEYGIHYTAHIAQTSAGVITVQLDQEFPLLNANYLAGGMYVHVSDGVNDPVPFVANIIVQNANRLPDFSDQTINAEISAIVNHTMQTLTLGASNDPGETYTWEILSGNTGNDWSIDAATGALTPVNALDHTRTASYSLEVKVTDNGVPTAASKTATVTINVSEDVLGDTDKDGLSDWWEVTYIGDLASGAFDDPDGDLWWNKRELAEKKHPNVVDVPDSDSDGWSDALEELVGSYPNNSASQPTLISGDIQADTKNFNMTGALTVSGRGAQWNALSGPMFTNGTQTNPSWTNLIGSDGSATAVDFGFTGVTTFYEGLGTLTGQNLFHGDYLILGVVGADASVGYQFSQLAANNNYVLAFYGVEDSSRGTDITIGSASKTNVGKSGFKAVAQSNSSGAISGTIKSNSGEGNLAGFELVGANPANRNPSPVIASATGSSITKYALPGSTVATISATGEGSEQLEYLIPFGNDNGFFQIDQNGVVTLTGILNDSAIGEHKLTVYVRDSLKHPSIVEVTVNVSAESNIAAITGGTPIMGRHDAADLTTAGVSYSNGNTVANILDGDSATRADTWNNGGAESHSFAGATFAQLQSVRSVEIDMAIFQDGGWFGVNGVGPGAGNALVDGTHVSAATAPVVQVTTDGGTTWANVATTDNYLSQVTGQTIGGGANPNPVSKKITFILPESAAPVNGVRVIGSTGGSAGQDNNGFIGVSELQVFGQAAQSNSAPTVNDATFAIAENGAANAAVGTVTASDPDANTTLTYSITAGNSAGLFAIGSNGAITATAALNHEAASQYVLTVQVSDGSLTDTAQVTVNVSNVNEAPVASNVTGSVNENLASGQVIGTVGVADPDAGDTVSFAITGGNASGHFAIASNGQVTTTGPLNFESASSYALTVEATDAGGLKDTATVNVTVGNVNEAPTASNLTASIAENSSTGSVVGTLAASDPDGDSLTYQITGGSGAALFAIASNGQITTTGALDHETASQYTLNVRVSDAAFNDTAVVTINVTDVNEAPSASNVTGTVAEGLAAGQVVGSVAATDPDGNTLTYQITGGNASGLFAIDANGQVTTTGALDFEAASQHSLTVQVSDSALTDTATVTVNVTEDTSNITNGGTAIAGVHNGTDLTTLGTAFTNNHSGAVADIIDNDLSDSFDTYNSVNGSESHSYVGLTWAAPRTDHVGAIELDIASYLDGGWFGVNNVGPGAGGTLADPTHISTASLPVVQTTTDGGTTWTTVASTNDYLSKLTGQTIGGGANPNPQLMPTVRFTLDTPVTGINGIRVIGTEGGTASRGFLAIAELNVFASSNSAPTANDATFAIAENGAANDVLGSVTATDAEGDSLTYQITAGNDAGLFAIDSSGQLTATAALDHEVASQYVLTVEVSDSSLTDTATVTVNVTDVNEAPTASNASATLAENGSAGAAVASVAATDPENDTLSYAITAGNDAGLFAIDSNGNVTTTAGLDFEAATQHVLTVEVSDSALTDTATVTVDVTNANEAPVASDLAGSVNENLAGGQVIGTVGVTDPDAGDTFGYAITAGNDLGLFAIDANGQITTTAALDFETASAYALTIEVTDAAGLKDTATANVTVGDVNEAPSASDFAGSVAENGAAGAVVGTVATSDPEGDALNYQITGGNASGLFAIAANGQITTTAELDHEAASQHVLTVQVSDGTLTDTATVTVNVTDVNEAPSASDLNASVAENAAAGAVVGTVASSDPESDSLTYQITTGNGAGLFVIAANGQITTTAELDHEAASQHVLTVQVSDGTLTDTATVTVDVTDVNEAPSATDFTASVAENGAAGVVVGTVATSDPEGGSLTFQITAGNTAGLFAIAANGQITTTGALDYETASQHVLTVQVSDGTLTDTATVTVDVTDMQNLAAGDVIAVDLSTAGGSASNYNVISSSGATIATGSVIAQADGSVRDGVSIALSAVNGFNDDGNAANWNGTAADTYYAVEADDIVFSPSPITLTFAGLDSSLRYNARVYALLNDGATDTVTVTDGETTKQSTEVRSTRFAATTLEDAGLVFTNLAPNSSGQLAVTVSSGAWEVLNAVVLEVVNPNTAPTANDATFAIAENGAANAVVGSVTATDPEGATLTYQITAGNDAGLFAIAANGQITATAALDHEATSQHVLTVQVSDGTLTDTAQVTVNVTDVNEAPVASDANATLAENGSAGAAVATVAATDPENGALTYAITGGNASGLFAINASGQVTTTGALDFEAASSHTLTVEVTDAGNLKDTATVAVSVTNVNEAPSVTNTSASIAENAAVGTTVVSVSASDPDAGVSLAYSITAGNTGNAFSIDSNGNVKVASALDYETTTSYTLTVQVSDGTLTDTATVTVNVTDVVEVTVPVISTGAASEIDMVSAKVAYSITDAGGEDPTITVFYGTTDGGQDAAAWAQSVTPGAQAVGNYTADLVSLTEGTQYYYTARATNSAGSVWGSTASFTTVADTSPKMVRTTVNNVSNTAWTTVDLGKNYNSAVVVATPIYPVGTTTPVVTRIRNVNGSSFELKLDRADGQTAAVNFNVSVVAVEEGVYTLANDGVQMEAVKFTSTVTAENNSWAAEARTMQNSYTAPVVVGQVMSANDANWSVFWAMGNSRTAIPSTSNFNVGKHVGEDPNATRADETVGYIVIETGSGSINGVAYEAAVGSKSIRGFGNSSTAYTYSLSGGLSSASAAAVSSAGMAGGNGGWSVLSGNTPLSTSSIGLHVVEDQMADSEQSHNTTQVGYLIFE